MKKLFVIFLVMLVIFSSGCTQTNTGAGNETNNTNTNDTNNNQPSSGEDNGDTILKEACSSAISDYPAWVKDSSAIIVWKDSTGFFYRRSPNDWSFGMDSLTESSEELLDMDFVNKDIVEFAKKSGNNWVVSKRDINGAQNIELYSKTEDISIRDIGYINENEFIVLYVDSGKAKIRYVKIGGTEEEFFNFDASPSGEKGEIWNSQKVSLSPKKTYFYNMFETAPSHGSVLNIFDTSTRKRVKEIEQVYSAVWIGDSHVLYSKTGGVYIYDVKNEKTYRTTLDSAITDLYFNPTADSGGIIAYNKNQGSYASSAYFIGCQDRQSINTKEHTSIEAFANKNTTIYTEYNTNSSTKESGYYEFTRAWIVKLSEKLSTFYPRSAIATVWSGY